MAREVKTNLVDIGIEIAAGKSELMSYLDIKHRMIENALISEVIVSKDDIRTKLVEAGLISFALTEWHGTDTNINVVIPKDSNHLIFRHPITGQWFRVEALRDYLKGQKPQTDEENIRIRQSILSQLNERKRLERELRAAKKGILAMGDWEYSRNTDMITYVIRPMNENLYVRGRYSNADLEAWLKDTGPFMLAQSTLDTHQERE